MSMTSSGRQDLARQLVALEVARTELLAPVGGWSEAVQACKTLSVPLTKLIGVVGFRSIMTRALSMSKVEVPLLRAVRVGEDGALEGFDGGGQTPDAEAGIAVVARLLDLLAIFIGDTLMLQLVREAWPAGLGADRIGETQV